MGRVGWGVGGLECHSKGLKPSSRQLAFEQEAGCNLLSGHGGPGGEQPELAGGMLREGPRRGPSKHSNCCLSPAAGGLSRCFTSTRLNPQSHPVRHTRSLP